MSAENNGSVICLHLAGRVSTVGRPNSNPKGKKNHSEIERSILKLLTEGFLEWIAIERYQAISVEPALALYDCDEI
jgi:hypothetical protein